MIADRTEVLNTLASIAEKLRQAFPGFIINMRLRNILGELPAVTIANVPTKERAPNGILENCSVYINGIIQAEKGGAYMVNPIVGRWGNFRKIKGANEIEVLEKFCAWMLKNSELIRNITPVYNRY